MPADGTEVKEKRLAYEGIQGLLENVAMGIEEKQAEMRKMDQSLSAKKMELIELEKTIRRRQMLLDLMSREIEEGMLRLKEEKRIMEEKKMREEEPANYTMVAGEPEELTARRDGIPGLQIMGVFTLCGLLVALDWGGVTSILVATAKAWTTKPLNKGTSTGELSAGNAMSPFKPATLSFRDERPRWERPRRATPAGRRARRARAWGIPEGQAGLGECSQREGSGSASLPRRMEYV
jgi:hypothetical protein